MTDNLHRIFIDDKQTKDGRKPAVVTGKYLCIAATNSKMFALDPTYRIYVITTNKPLLSGRFSWEKAQEVAELIEKTYGEYLEIFDVYPDWDVLAIARYSVPNGETVYNQLVEL